MHIQDLASKIIDKPGETFKVHRSLYTDPELFELEIKHIWEGTWVFIAHESQIPKPNDYLTTVIGRQPVIISRGADGKLRGFINACSHRGTMICRKPRGSAKLWVCPYHAWTYNNQGKLIGIKQESNGGYPEHWSKDQYGLTPVPHVESYHGFIFASLNADVPDIETHLAGAAKFVELFSRQSPDGLEVLRGHSVYTHRGNWKMQAENGVDGYHPDIVHASYFRLAHERAKKAAAGGTVDDVKAVQVDPENSLHGVYDLGNGHVMMWTDVPNFRDRPLGMQYDALVEREGEVRAKWMAGRVRQIMLYPNVVLFDGISTQLRSWRPIAADQTEVHAYCVAPKGEPEAARERRIRQYEDFYGASGIATPDDLTEFDACQSGYLGRNAEWQDFDRGMARRIIGADEPAREIGATPVVSAPDVTDETHYHGEYRQWLKLMTEGVLRSQAQSHVA
ncbi:MAG TPA: aromatic ring-hydroxylating dioxygenase subunit alpha [Allosphingosinicella sp.]|nr:aromatic ring-hydroxylating dioxygenase subunit alpha [Allosphingosinicella sp.]